MDPGESKPMSVDEKTRAPESRGLMGRLAWRLAQALVPTERTILTREGGCYFGVMLVLLVAGLYQQVNLILLVSTLAAGPFLTSWIGSRAFLRRLSVVRRAPPYVFSGDPLPSITRSRTAGDGPPRWPCSWKIH